MRDVETVTSSTGTARPVKIPLGRKYLYAIVWCNGDRRYDKLGLAEQDAYTISEGQLAAVVSDISLPRVRPERRNLGAHQGVLKALMAESTPLPMSFGIIAESPAAIRKILLRNRKMFTEQLKRVLGKVEMGLRVSWDVPNIFEYFVNTNAELRAARDRFLGGNREPTQEDKIEIGRMFDHCLNETRDKHTTKIQQVLQPACSELLTNPYRNECEVMNLACLVRNSSLEAFETQVLQAAKHFDNNFVFDYNGPWAPHNFVHVDLAP